VPKAQPRARASVTKSGKVRAYDPGTAEGWKSLVALAARDHLPESPIDGPLGINLNFLMPRPGGKCRKRPHPEDDRLPHDKKPDLDNLTKAVLDVLTQIGFWRDDSQIWRLTATKEMHRDKGGRPGCSVSVWRVRNKDLEP